MNSPNLSMLQQHVIDAFRNVADAKKWSLVTVDENSSKPTKTH